MENDAERFEAIGRAVVELLMPDNPAAARQATPERVCEYIKRISSERDSYANSQALRVGRVLLTLKDTLLDP